MNDAPSSPSLFDDAEGSFAGEAVSQIAQLAGGRVRVERIVSLGQGSPEGFWYDQPEDEWVAVLTGEARLTVMREKGRAEEIVLRPGQHVFLPSRCRHRVEWTSPDEPTVWLAVFAQAE